MNYDNCDDSYVYGILNIVKTIAMVDEAFHPASR